MAACFSSGTSSNRQAQRTLSEAWTSALWRRVAETRAPGSGCSPANPAATSGNSAVRAPQSCSTRMKTSGRSSSRAREISFHNRSAVRASSSPLATISCISSSVFGRHLETQAAIAGGETGDAQHAQWIFGEGRRDVTQQARLKIRAPAIGVDDLAIVVFGHGIDGQVAADQILFQGDVRCGVEGEATIAAPALAFGAGEGVFLAVRGCRNTGKSAPTGR